VIDNGPDAVRLYPCGGGSVLQVYTSPQNAGTSTATVASWSVPAFDEQIQELLVAGVRLERYEGMPSDENGVHAFGTHKVAWFLDPDGNTIAIDNGGAM